MVQPVWRTKKKEKELIGKGDCGELKYIQAPEKAPTGQLKPFLAQLLLQKRGSNSLISNGCKASMGKTAAEER